MGETDISHEFGREPGFSQVGFLQFLTLLVLICYTWRFYWDVSWMLNHRKIQNCQNCSQNCPNFKIRVYFQFMGLGHGFWVWTGLLPALTQKRHQLHHHLHHHQPSCKLTKSSVCVCHQSIQSERVVCHHWFACAMGLSTVPAACHHARSVPAYQRVIPEVSVLPWTFPGGSRSPRCPEGQDIVPLCQMAQNPQDCTYGVAFTCNDDICVLSLSCDGLLAVFVTINCFIVWV